MLQMGAAVLMPIIFLLLALLVGVKVGQALKAALLIGVGFTGLGIVIQLLLDHLGPATNQIVERFGVDLTIIDTGWAVSSTIGWSSPLMIPGILLFLLINTVMFLCNLTRTVNIDIFNYWIFLVVGTVLYAATDRWWLSLGIMAILFILLLKIADWTAPKMQAVYGVQGLSFPHMNTAPWIPLGIVVNAIINRMPGVRQLRWDAAKLNRTFGVFGEPIMIGCILGALIGILAGFAATAILSLAINVAAAMVLLPKMVEILMQGLNIVREIVQQKLRHRYPKRDIYIGMDVAVITTDPAILATGVLLIPIALLLAILLPGNQVLPLVDLPSLIFVLPMLGAYCGKDMFRMLIAGTIMVIGMLYFGTSLAPYYTEAAQLSHISLGPGIQESISLNSGATTPLGWLAIWIGQGLDSLFSVRH